MLRFSTKSFQRRNQTTKEENMEYLEDKKDN